MKKLNKKSYIIFSSIILSLALTAPIFAYEDETEPAPIPYGPPPMSRITQEEWDEVKTITGQDVPNQRTAEELRQEAESDYCKYSATQDNSSIRANYQKYRGRYGKVYGKFYAACMNSGKEYVWGEKLEGVDQEEWSKITTWTKESCDKFYKDVDDETRRKLEQISEQGKNVALEYKKNYSRNKGISTIALYYYYYYKSASAMEARYYAAGANSELQVDWGPCPQ